jgi:hypothetical protein
MTYTRDLPLFSEARQRGEAAAGISDNMNRPQRKWHEKPSNGLLTQTDLERFWLRVNKNGDDCWTWTGFKNELGYGLFSLDHKHVKAHRVSWMVANGKIPDGLCVLHSCDNPICVNPSHLFLGTMKDNTQDMLAKGRQSNQYTKATHCENGHEYGEKDKNGWRRCKACQLERQLARRSNRISNGLCPSCGRALMTGAKLCAYHHDKMLERGRKAYCKARAGLIVRTAETYQREHGHGTVSLKWRSA